FVLVFCGSASSMSSAQNVAPSKPAADFRKDRRCSICQSILAGTQHECRQSPSPAVVLVDSIPSPPRWPRGDIVSLHLWGDIIMEHLQGSSGLQTFQNGG